MDGAPFVSEVRASAKASDSSCPLSHSQMCHGGGAMEKRLAENAFQPAFPSQQGSTGVSGDRSMTFLCHEH